MTSFISKRSRKGIFFLAVPVLLVVALFAASCGSDDDSSGDFTVGLVYDIGGRGDQSFNDSAYDGVNRAKNDLGISFNEVSPNSDGSNREELIALQAANRDIVLGVGFLFGDAMQEVSAANPDVFFGLVDDGPRDTSPENLAHLTFAEHEGSYLVGIAAALKTETDSVGFIGGVRLGLIEKFEAGYIAGVESVNPNIAIDSRYITEPPNFDGFNDPAQAKIIAASMYEGGADVIYHAAGGSGGGLFEAAKEHSESSGSKVWAIGVDSDQYNTVDADLKEYVLTSMIKRVDVAVYGVIENAVNGNFAGGQSAVVYDLSVDGVGYSTSGGFVDDIVDELEAAKAGIISGSISVPSTP